MVLLEYFICYFICFLLLEVGVTGVSNCFLSHWLISGMLVLLGCVEWCHTQPPT